MTARIQAKSRMGGNWPVQLAGAPSACHQGECNRPSAVMTGLQVGDQRVGSPKSCDEHRQVEKPEDTTWNQASLSDPSPWDILTFHSWRISKSRFGARETDHHNNWQNIE